MKNFELTLKINAEFQWIYPASNKEEEVFREETNVRIAFLASKLEQATKLILLEMAGNSIN